MVLSQIEISMPIKVKLCNLLRFSPPYVNENNAKEVNKKRDDVSPTT